MPQFFISVNHSDDFQMPEGVSIEQLHTDVMAFNEKMAAEQRIVFVGALEQPASDARLVDATSGEPMIAPHINCAHQAGHAHARIDNWAEALPWLLDELEKDPR